MVALVSAERGADHRQPQNMAVADWPVVGLAAPIGHIKSKITLRDEPLIWYVIHMGGSSPPPPPI